MSAGTHSRRACPPHRRPGANWENSNYAHGKRLAVWVRTYVKAHELDLTNLVTIRRYSQAKPPTSGNWTSRLQRWESGSHPSFWDVDRAMTELGVHISQLPDEVWM